MLLTHTSSFRASSPFQEGHAEIEGNYSMTNTVLGHREGDTKTTSYLITVQFEKQGLQAIVQDLVTEWGPLQSEQLE